jgi:hypothetical protein
MGESAMMKSIVSRYVSLSFVGFVIFMTSGCGASNTGSQADPNEAEKTVKLVLDAWKNGEKLSDVSMREPGIVINDMDWTLGHKLVRYKPSSESRVACNDMQYPVELELKSPKGRIVKKQAIYHISTTPQKLVLRQDG